MTLKFINLTEYNGKNRLKFSSPMILLEILPYMYLVNCQSNSVGKVWGC